MAEGKTQLPHQLLIGRPQGYYLFRLTSLPSGPPAEPDEFCFYSAKTSAAASLCYVVESHVCKAPTPSTTCLKCNPTCTSPQFIPTSLCSQPAETLFLISSLFFFIFIPYGCTMCCSNSRWLLYGMACLWDLVRIQSCHTEMFVFLYVVTDFAFCPFYSS